MLSSSLLTLFLLIVFTVFFIGSPSKFAFASVVQITFTSALPNIAEEGLVVRCSNGEHSFALFPDEDDEWSVHDDVTRTCDANWDTVFRSFDVYQPNGDGAGKSSVYWLVKEDGFYHSWDKSNWNHAYDWEHK